MLFFPLYLSTYLSVVCMYLGRGFNWIPTLTFFSIDAEFICYGFHVGSSFSFFLFCRSFVFFVLRQSQLIVIKRRSIWNQMIDRQSHPLCPNVYPLTTAHIVIHQQSFSKYFYEPIRAWNRMTVDRLQGLVNTSGLHFNLANRVVLAGSDRISSGTISTDIYSL